MRAGLNNAVAFAAVIGTEIVGEPGCAGAHCV